jgi:hypothetical protein
MPDIRYPQFRPARDCADSFLADVSTVAAVHDRRYVETVAADRAPLREAAIAAMSAVMTLIAMFYANADYRLDEMTLLIITKPANRPSSAMVC